MPHPSESKIHIRIQTKGTELFFLQGAPACAVLKKGFSDLREIAQHLLQTFENAHSAYENSHVS